MNVFPFILRGVSLMGVDSVQVPMADRLPVWDKLAGPWKPAHLMDTVTECSLEELDSRIDAILKADPGFPRCFAEKLLTYALGRGLEPYDRPTVLRIVEEARMKDFRFSSFVHAIVATEAFTMRRTSGEPR